MKNIAIILSGCGFLDGAEVTETVSTLISLDQKKCNYEVFAPNREVNTINHASSETQPPRNILDEACRITRGNVQPLEALNPQNFDGIALPGGFGVAKNLSNWYEKASKCSVDDTLSALLKSFHKDSKPILAICISPALVAKVLGDHGITLTIGSHEETANEIEKTGCIHEQCSVDDYITDRLNKVISTPAYMCDATPAQVFKGIQRAVSEFYEMC